ncbi:MAG: phosphatidate cytidylyltransferase [Gammaproteobacteria bacterium]|uniref:phosphatidate cytidylyltransferase n=1 Tax=Rhodoferax sp. TaxID=50421 RepID=UPI0017BD0DB2|nr:phosphatidate cytidylyltransferase [Rhodoferax sp.]MBU3899035.1 phosphatidate cytidylyltransferase [Gammaproteobacteria bacterium]MBA3057665.1 phosphatidate cytidylyltransferase [Rhodoferax sp.]MBU3998253.1 phosphatidate cytidylyltransferase [Gammaproteobacteria bacterium]MBU4018478.1 phosphatidate cytidylyltransferase [Gammaproteobacteria bacterium]MBU4080490.1 phosphatidate cytidylyltransferase [Gammaproteobacteria bacterium]
MLKQRVITALIMLLILLPAMFYRSPEPFCAIALVLIAAGAWEWARLNGYGPSASLAVGAVCALLCAAAWWSGWLDRSLAGLWLVAGAVWVLAGAWVLRRGVSAWSAHPRTLRLLAGLLALCLAWLAVAQARVIGVNFLLSILVLVWVADIGAYFAGRTFGGRFSRSKLAPSISPGKSWEGVWGGMAGVIVLAFAWRWLDSAWASTVPSFYTHLGQHGGWLLLIVAVFLAAMSVVGDLFESLVKRSASVKDSSGLLPGHGGVLDRVDALLPTLPLAMMLYSVSQI